MPASLWPAVIGLVMMVGIIALVFWSLQLLQSAGENGDFSLTLAGCMVGSAAIGLATVHWTVWLGGILGVVLALVLLLGYFS